MSPKDRLQAALGELASLSLRRRPEAAVQIRTASALAQAFEACSAGEREEISGQLVGTEEAKKLVSLSGLLSEVAVSTRDPTLIRNAIILNAIEGYHWDYRESVRHLVLIFYAATAIGVDPKAALTVVRDLIPARGLSIADGTIRSWAGDWSRSLTAMGVKAETGPNGFRFVPAAPQT